MHGLDVDPLTDIAICSGQTEAFAAAVFALIDPGDEVILFDPSYETYGGCITMAGGIPVCVDLDPPHWTSDPNKAYEAFYCQNKSYNIEQVGGLDGPLLQLALPRRLEISILGLQIVLQHHFRRLL